MARGFLSGAVVGTVVSLGVAGVASVLADGPVVPNVSDAAPVKVTTEAGTSQAGIDAVKKDADLVQDGATSVTQPSQDDVAAVTQAGSDLSQQPETGGVEGLLTPDAVASDGAVVVDSEAPVLPSPQAIGPTAPDSETELSISTDPAQPPAPQVPESESAFEEAAVAPESESVFEEAAVAPESVERVEAEEETAEPEPVEPETAEPELAEPDVVAETPAAEPDLPAQQPAQPQAPEIEEEDSLPQADSLVDDNTRPTIGRPAGTLVDRDTSVVEDEIEEVASEDTRPPLKAHAVPFDRTDDKPLMSIVLIDSGDDQSSAAIGLPALRSFPAPVTFAVDASLPDAAERMRTYRGEGFEVLAMVNLPTASTAMDAEVVLNAVLSEMNEVVGVIEGVDTGMQEVREASDQATQILLSSGHGFVAQSKGLNTVAKLAERAGVPTATVFRDFDSADQTPSVIRRFLDQAAFRAGQEGGVIMLGRLRADTISALLLWGLQDRASTVALAPVSAVLKK